MKPFGIRRRFFMGNKFDNWVDHSFYKTEKERDNQLHSLMCKRMKASIIGYEYEIIQPSK
jgi:hypothetical protein